MSEEFHAIDCIFAQTICPEDLPAQAILSKLLHGVRLGKLSLALSKNEEMIAKRLPKEHCVVNEGELYLARHFESKSQIMHHLKRLQTTQKENGFKPEQLASYTLAPKQREAVWHALSKPLTFISGGPGSGKSYTAAILLQVAATKLKVVATAPTGKACARLRSLLEGIDCDVQTLHSLLAIGRKSRVTRLDFDLVLMDESAMVDVRLFQQLLGALKNGAQLVCVGDRDQLPPVEGASLFSELMTSHIQDAVQLKGSHRTENKEILELAAKAKGGEPFDAEPLPSVNGLVEMVLEETKKANKLSIAEQVHFYANYKVLTPLRRGAYGADQLNAKVMERATGPIPIMMTTNDHEKLLYNGDCGLLCGQDVHFGDGRIFKLWQLGPYTPAYFMSVHKSQGSEYERVVLLLPPGSERFGSEVIYTAITRAKKKIQIFGNKNKI